MQTYFKNLTDPKRLNANVVGPENVMFLGKNTLTISHAHLISSVDAVGIFDWEVSFSFLSVWNTPA